MSVDRFDHGSRSQLVIVPMVDVHDHLDQTRTMHVKRPAPRVTIVLLLYYNDS